MEERRGERERETCVVMTPAGRKGGPCHSMNNIKTSGHRSLYWSFHPADHTRTTADFPLKTIRATSHFLTRLKVLAGRAGQGLILINATFFCWSIKNLRLKLNCTRRWMRWLVCVAWPEQTCTGGGVDCGLGSEAFHCMQFLWANYSWILTGQSLLICFFCGGWEELLIPSHNFSSSPVIKNLTRSWPC